MRKSRSILLVSAAALALAIGCAKKPDDAQLTTNIKAQMFSDPQTKDTGLQVAVKDGIVTLSGTIPSDAARYEAYKLAMSTPGVTKVNDQMVVQAPEQTAQATPAPEETPAPAVKAAPERKPERHARPMQHKTPAAAAAAAPAAASASAAAAPATPSGPQPVTANFPVGTTLEIQTVDPIDSATNHVGDEFQATLAQPLTWDSRVVAPVGTNVYLRLAKASTAGHYKGQSELQVELVRIEFQGQQYPVSSSTYTLAGGSRGKNTAAKVGGGAALGAIIGAIAGGGKGAAIGAGVGAAGGGVYQGVTKGKQVRIPAETKLDFKLDQPLEITYTPR